jgi:hypothetical protein
MIVATQKEELKPVQWSNFENDGTTYDLKHLHPCTLQFERPADEKKPAAVFNVDVIFGLHCFSREIPAGAYDRKLIYSDARESRLFDFERYELSKRLPAIIESLSQRKCFQTDRSDFVTRRGDPRRRNRCQLPRILHGLESHEKGSPKSICFKRLFGKPEGWKLWKGYQVSVHSA